MIPDPKSAVEGPASLFTASSAHHCVKLPLTISEMRSLQHLVQLFAEFKALGVDLYLHQQHVDSSTPAGRALLQMSGVFAEFERAMLKERINAGLARARAQGKHLGRKRTLGATDHAILKLRKQGMGMVAIGRELGCGMARVQAVVKGAAA